MITMDTSEPFREGFFFTLAPGLCMLIKAIVTVD